MRWAQSLIKISKHQVETLQKRLADIVDRRSAAEVKLVVLQAEGEAEAMRWSGDALAGLYQVGYQQGLRMRKAEVQGEIDALLVEEAGARDALSLAYEELKKYEQVLENAQIAAAREGARRETAAMDELGLRAAR